MYVHLMDRVLNDYIIVIIHTLVHCKVSAMRGQAPDSEGGIDF